MKFRPYQAAAIAAIFAYFANGGRGNPLVVMPTGTGKSVVVGGFIRDACFQYPQTRVMMLTQSATLVEQNYEKQLQIWPGAPVGIFCDELKRKERGAPITFGTIGSVVRRAREFGRVNLLVIDEAHGVSPKDETMYRRFINDLLAVNPLLKIIGLTATPFRMGQGMIVEPGGIFTDIVYDDSTFEAFNGLLAEGYLCPLVAPLMRTQIDVSGVKMSGGDLNLKQLQAVSDREEVTRACLEETIYEGRDRAHWLIFATGTEHVEHVAEMLREMDVTACAVHSKMTKDDKRKAIEGFKSGKYQAAVNNNILTTGFDMPGIDLISVLRATMSPGLWVQMLGRGTRPLYAPGFDLETTLGRLNAIASSQKRNCRVLDFAGNRRRLGPINDPVKPKTRRKGPAGDAPYKLCPVPECRVFNHTSARFCSECGHVFEQRSKLEESVNTEELIRGADVPIQVEEITLQVDAISYTKHVPRDSRPPSLLVTYSCGPARKFKQYICIEHGGFAAQRAREWFATRTHGLRDLMPKTVDEALSLVDTLKRPVAIDVWDRKPRPEVLREVFAEQLLSS